MVQILDQHLDKLQCSECQKYLSVFPVKVYKDGAIKCGRCTKPNDGGITSLYEVIAKHCLFKCINRYEGCRKLLLASEVAAHEETCTSRKYTCPHCEISSEMLSHEILQHFKISHNKHFLTSNVFYLSLSKNIINKERYCYVQDDIIFIILLQYVPYDKCLFICAVTLGEMKDVKQRYIISTDTVPFKQVTAIKKCVSTQKFNYDDYYKIDLSNILTEVIKFEIILDPSSVQSYDVEMVSVRPSHSSTKSCQTIPEVQNHTIQMTSKFYKEYPMYNLTACGTALYSNTKRIELTCSNCKEMMASNVFNCQLKKHFVCWDCKEWCGICECAINGWNSEVSTLSEFLLFPCKWKCGAKVSGGDLRSHNLFCDLNKRKCPICNTVMTTKYLKTHLPQVHRCEFIEEFNLTQFLRRHNRSGDRRYFIKNNNMFKLKWRVYNNQYDLQITPCDTLDLKLFLIKNNECEKIDSSEFTVNLESDPKFYLKH